jgi:PAS domain S-box-containing protein
VMTPAQVSDAVSIWNSATTGAGRILPNTSTITKSTTAPTPMLVSSESNSIVGSGGNDATAASPQVKKQLKRAANRRSAQLSRKRKKQFIEELKEENDDLRRKEQILRAIPDLIVVFDSSGKLRFVSESVGRFIDMSPEELIGSSFWDRLCEDSVRLLKAGFMDSLAARQAQSDTAPLGNGVWELRLVDKNSNFFIVTLNGVVHFKGDVPECVCCIRPQRENVQKVGSTRATTLSAGTASAGTSSKNLASILKPVTTNSSVVVAAAALPVSSSDGSRSLDGSGNEEQQLEQSPEVKANPRQSVVGRDGNADSAEEDEEELEESDDEEEVADLAAACKLRVRSAVNISDGDSVEISESGSDEGVVSSLL